MSRSGERRMEEVSWRVLPLETPKIRRHCAHCGSTTFFMSSDRFRVNAQQKRVDVWLIYRCTDCDATWNFPVHHRRTPAEIGGSLFELFLANDREVSWRFAFDLERLRKHGATLEAAVAYRIVRSAEIGGGACRIELEIPFPCGVRLDRLLAEGMGVSRSRIARWSKNRRLSVPSEGQRALRRPARDGQVIELAGP